MLFYPSAIVVVDPSTMKTAFARKILVSGRNQTKNGGGSLSGYSRSQRPTISVGVTTT